MIERHEVVCAPGDRCLVVAERLGRWFVLEYVLDAAPEVHGPYFDHAEAIGHAVEREPRNDQVV